MEKTPEQRVIDGSAWSDFCDDLKRIGEQIQRPETPVNAADRAEGYRYLTHVLRSTFDIFIDHADPEFPVLYRVCDEVIKYGADNPDNYYQKCVLSGTKRYRISGHRGTVPYLSFLTQGTTYTAESQTQMPTGYLEGTALEVEEDGSFEIMLSVDEQPGNWLPMKPETQALLIRQTHHDRKNEEIAQIEIECLDAPPVPRPIDPRAFEQGLRSATGFLGATAELFCDWSERFQAHSNALPLDDQELCQRVGGDPKIAYYNSHWALAEDEALAVDIEEIPECETWNFQLCNYWMESFDYRYQRIHLNKFTADYDEKGGVRIIVSDHDPGAPNWLSTCGHRTGTMTMRMVGADRVVDVETRVVKLTELESEFRKTRARGRSA